MSRALRLAAKAQQDLASILAFTRKAFGDRQAAIYSDALERALSMLCERTDLAGSRPRDDLSPGLRSFHVGRLGGRGRHVIFFQVRDDGVLVSRILHEAMDPARQLSKR